MEAICCKSNMRIHLLEQPSEKKGAGKQSILVDVVVVQVIK